MLIRKSRTAINLLHNALRTRFWMRQSWQGHGTPRVLFIADSDGVPYHYRVRNQVEQLRLTGCDTAVCYPHSIHAIRAIRQCDSVVLYRPDDTPALRELVRCARLHNIPVVYDTDDLTWDERLLEYAALERYYGSVQLPDFRRRIQRERAVLSMADLAITSTEYLAGLIRSDFNIPVHVNMNAISQATLRVTANGTSQQQASPSFIIGYFSGWARAHEIDLITALPAIQRALADLPHAQLRVVGHFDRTWLPTELQAQLQHAPFVPYEQLFAAIAATDINLAPLVNNPHRRSKSAVKFLEAALVGVPTIATNLEPYQLIRHGETGMLATTIEDWYTSIMALATDAGLRYQLGNAARAQVLAEHTTTVRAAGLRNILEHVSM
jgi:O-antigen biosynthesis protein